jgi:iron complex transport system ATP-binding protein
MLKTESISVGYGPRIVVEDITLEVAPGEILALIGPNGAGKTTLVRAVSGTVPLVSGQIRIDGQELSQLTIQQRARLLAVVPQARQLGGAFTVEQAVMMGRTAFMSWLGRESESDKRAVHQAMRSTNLLELSDRPIAQLSGGEQQRVLLARALAQNTPVLLLDEPTNHLDLHHQTNLLSLVKNLTKKIHLSVMMAMHDLNLVSFIADKVALLVNGSLICYGTPNEVLQADRISDAYQTPVEIITHPSNGVPIIFPNNVYNPDVDGG